MSRTSLDSPTRTALAAPHVISFLLMDLGFDSGTLYLTSAPHDVTWGGNNYTCAQGIGSIEPTVETDTQAQGLTFTLSGVPASAIAGALTEPVQGRRVVLRLAVVDNGTLRVDPNVWAGNFDQMTIEDSLGGPVIRVTAEHAMIAWGQASGQLFSDQDQRTVDGNDEFFSFAAQMAEATIVWPNKDFGR